MQTHQPRHASPKGRHAKPKEHNPNSARRRRNTVGGVILAMLATFVLGSPVAQAGEEPTVVTAQIVSTPDNDCPPWARDTFTRTTTITKEDDLEHKLYSKYSIRLDDSGTFLAESGIEGTIDGYVEYLVYGNLKPDQVEDLSGKDYDYSGLACKGDASELPKTSEWALQYFGDKAYAKPITDWKYVYETPCQTHVEKSGSEAVGAETFKFCVTPDEPTFTHPVCVDDGTVESGTWTIPESEGTAYNPTESGELAHGESIEVEATPKDGYVFPDDADTTWPFLAVTVPCDGSDGKDGSDGTDGEDGETPEPATSDKDCTDFDSVGQVVFHLTQYPGDFDRMDGDDDGFACNSYFGDGADDPDEEDDDPIAVPTRINTGR